MGGDRSGNRINRGRKDGQDKEHRKHMLVCMLSSEICTFRCMKIAFK